MAACFFALAVYLVAPSSNARADNIPVNGDKSEMLAKSLRRQLIKNNYDYMSSESHETFQTQPHFRRQYQSYKTTHDKDSLSDKNPNIDSNEDMPSGNYRQKQVHRSHKKPFSRDSDNVEDINIESSISNSDVKSITEDLNNVMKNKKTEKSRRKKIPGSSLAVHGERKKDRSRYKDYISYEDSTIKDPHHLHNNYYDHRTTTTTTVKYKILKVKNTYRRNGNPATLIEEETADGVAIMNLGRGPIPEFRLPHARRQYMHLPDDVGAISDDDELPPPPVNETNTDTDPNVNEEPRSTLHAEHNKEAQNMSLVITLTPDEIIVL